LPNNLNIKRELTIRETPISAKYTKEEILKMIIDKGGSINGKIYSY